MGASHKNALPLGQETSGGEPRNQATSALSRGLIPSPTNTEHQPPPPWPLARASLLVRGGELLLKRASPEPEPLEQGRQV
jgi:hypothetical protein